MAPSHAAPASATVLAPAAGARHRAPLCQAPYLHDGATAAMGIRIADILVREGDCLSGG